MKRTFTYSIVLLVCTLLCGYAFAQPQARGFGNAAPAAASTSAGRTVALVVGVSDYPYVAPLNYAADDALLMYKFLQSKAGGNVPIGNIRFLANEEATLQNMWTRGLSWLENTIKPTTGDRVIIYMAGHGDAISSDESFFLCYNANPAGERNNYHVTGALNITILKNRIAKFSAAGAEVVLIMDACRSGDLPGVRTGITNPFESVVERKAGETLMLSASANQLAVEDRRWGRGHGVFTWNLIQGLSGKADENGDGSVDFYEIEQYTKAKVRKETQAMGRMQVPQFAASPSGGGVLGRTDNVFLNKLSTEALSAVSVSESIAQARTAAESSWFTDSTLYAGFNEIKKLVRQNKYLGEGSAEPIYTRLTEQFSAEQIEPVRLYYMSALASAGFEAINQELLLNIGVTLTTKFYERRWAYLNKAYHLQRKPDEVYQLENYRKLVEAIYLKNSKSDLHGGISFSQGMVDSLSDMRFEFIHTAAYYYWMREFNINPYNGSQGIVRHYLVEFDGVTKVVNSDVDYNWLLDSCVKYAPTWPKVLIKYLTYLPQRECDQIIGSKVRRLVAEDSLNSEYWYVLSKYYLRHKPYNLNGWYHSILKSIELEPNSISLDDIIIPLIEVSSDKTNEFSSLHNWLLKDAILNCAGFRRNNREFDIISSASIKILEFKDDDERTLERKWRIYNSIVNYYALNNKLSILAGVLSQETDFEFYGDRSMAILSSLFQMYPVSKELSNAIDENLMKRLSDNQHVSGYFNDYSYFIDRKYIFYNKEANLAAWRILSTKGIPEFDVYRKGQWSYLSNFNYSYFREELLLFKAVNMLMEDGKGFDVVFSDTLLNSIKRLPSNKKIELYAELLQLTNMGNRIIEILADSSIIERSNWLKILLEAKYYCSIHDTLQLNALLNSSLVKGDENYYFLILEEIEDFGQMNIDLNQFIFPRDTSYCYMKKMIRCGQYSYARDLYKNLQRQNQNLSALDTYCKADIDVLDMYIALEDYANASDLIESLIDKAFMGDNFWIEKSIDTDFINYDAFIQSKEYKAMMSRVYTAPEK